MGATVALAFSVGKGFMQLQAARAQQRQALFGARSLETQAEFTRFKAKQDSLKHKKQSVLSLASIIENLASINAAGGAGTVDIRTGNISGLNIKSRNIGGINYATAKGNEEITRLIGEQQADFQIFQANNLRKAAATIGRQGMTQAAMTIAMGAYNYWKVQTPVSGGANFSSNNSNLLTGGSPTNWYSDSTGGFRAGIKRNLNWWD